MAYIGQSLTEGIRRAYTFTATASQTTFNAVYGVGAVDVYQNGILLQPADYTATTGTTVVLGVGAAVNDEITIIAHNTFSVADTVSASQGGTFAGDVTHSGTLTANGAFTSLGIDDNATSTAMTLDSSGNVGIGTSSITADGLQIVEATQPDFFMGNTADPDGFRITYNSTDTSIGTHSNTPLRIRTNGTERMRIDGSGNIQIQDNPTTSPYEGAIFENLSNGVRLNIGRSTNAVVVGFYNNNGFVGSISTSGSSTAYNTSSDYRLKENVTDVTDGITRVKQLAPKRFNFIADADTTVNGFLAHEVSSIVPEAITGTKDAVDDDGNPVFQGIDQSKLVPLLTAALQEAIAKIETLETENTAIKARLDALDDVAWPSQST